MEGAIKAARKYAYLKDGKQDHEIIAFNHSFHGRSYGALSVTGTAKYREPFEPMIGNIKFADMNDLESVKSLVTDKTCAIVLETVQGEGGIYPAEPSFLEGIRALCDEKDILLILDEVQCGMGRCGAMYAWQLYGVKPDIMTTAKALGCGFPVGAFLMTERVAQNSLTSGDHGTTYGGNPLGAAAINRVLTLFEQEHIIEHVKETAVYLEAKLETLVQKYACVETRRGCGLMQGLVLDRPAGEVAAKAIERGLIVITAGTNVIRMLPPLVIAKEHVDEMIEILTECLDEL